ncbi:diacylglycerol kinase [Marinomonas agarivorans]|nr:diacylglycerol kinase [Marinomonas agarivorans]
MAKPGKRGITRVLHAMRYSYQGLKAQWQHEEAFRMEVILFLLALPLALYFGVTGFEKAVLIFSVGIVVIVETLNSAMEAAIDRIGDEYHELSGRAKDMGSAAVMLSLGLALVVWVLILFF